MSGPSIHANNFDRVAGIYDATRGLLPEVAEQVGSGLSAILSAQGATTLLEVGVGTGRIAVLLADRGFRLTGTDISLEMLRILRSKRRDVATLLASDSLLPFRPKTFDAVLFSHVLHLVPSPAETVRAALECLASGGLLLNCEHVHRDDLNQRTGKRMNEIILELTGRPGRYHARRANDYPDFAATVDGLGGTIETRQVAHWTEITTLRREVTQLQNRVNSNSWTIPDDAMPAIIDRFLSEATLIYGGLDVESSSEASFEVSIARFPR